MNLSEEKSDYRRSADNGQVVLPQVVLLQYWRLNDEEVNWQLVRELILKFRRQKQEVHLCRKFNIKTEPKYYHSCGHLIPPFTIKHHTGFSIRYKVRPPSHWAPVTQKAILDEEIEWRYNNYLLRPFKRDDYQNGQLTQLWGREEVENALQQHAKPRAFLVAQMTAAAQFLSKDEGLAILLEPRTPRLSQLKGETKALGFVAYFLDCWQQFHDYERAAPTATGLADAGAAIITPIEKATSREPKIAKIAPNITQEEVRKIVLGAGMGEKYTKPGEWAAALRALHVAGILKGTAPEVTRWAIGQGYIESSAKETVKKVWSGEWNQAEQFTNNTQRSAFRNILASAKKLLTVNRLSNDNE